MEMMERASPELPELGRGSAPPPPNASGSSSTHVAHLQRVAGDPPKIALLTGGGDRHYSHGLALRLAARGVALDFIGSDQLESEELLSHERVRFLNLRGATSRHGTFLAKATRILRYYARLLRYAASARPRVFHILWNNRFEHFDRTVLLLFYRLLGKKIVLTVHNVNAAARDGHDSAFNRATLRFQYRCVHHMFVHTLKMEQQLRDQFGVAQQRISVIPFGINDVVPQTTLDTPAARRRLGVAAEDRCILFFGNIAPYKGLDCLIQAMSLLRTELSDVRLIIAGQIRGSETYWQTVRGQIETLGLVERVTERIEFIPEDDIEVYFKAADVLALPYRHIFQSGVLFLSYNFGLPVVASDVGSFREDIIEGETGFVYSENDAPSLARALESYFSSELFQSLGQHRVRIRALVNEHHSWERVAEITEAVYGAVSPH
jgi:glycosyltransferase involved in cell wall biosynthesis